MPARRRSPACPPSTRQPTRRRLALAVAAALGSSVLPSLAADDVIHLWNPLNAFQFPDYTERWSRSYWEFYIPQVMAGWDSPPPATDRWGANFELSGQGWVQQNLPTGTTAVPYASLYRTSDGLVYTVQDAARRLSTLSLHSLGQEVRMLDTASLSFAEGGLLRTGNGSGPVIQHRITGGAIVLGGVPGNGSLTVQTGDHLEIASTVRGAGSLVKDGGQRLTLSAANTYSGGTTVRAGELRAAHASALGSGAVTLAGGNLMLQTALDLGGLQFGDGSVAATGQLVALPGTSLRLLQGDISFRGAAGRSTGGALLTTDTELAGLQHGLRSVGGRASGAYDIVVDARLSGRGQLVVDAGPGQIALTRRNSHAGGTELRTGTLVLGATDALPFNGLLQMASGTTLLLSPLDTTAAVLAGGYNQTLGGLAGGGRIQVGAATLTIGGNQRDSSFEGSLDGSGALVKTGAGRLSFSTPTALALGSVRVDAGTLALDARSLAPSMTVTGTLDVATPVTTAYAGQLGGTGTVRKDGSGVLQVTGRLAAGSLQVLAGEVHASSQRLDAAVALTGGLLQFDEATDGVFARNISGTGGLRKLGAGNLRLTGSNSFSGETTVLDGGLTVNTTSLVGPVNVAQGFLQFEQDGDGSFAGQLRGSGTLVKSRAGTLQLTAASSGFTGQTIVTGGGRLVIDHRSLGGNIQIADGTLEFRQAADGSFARTVSGAGQLLKTGAGTLQLASTSRWTGTTRIDGGVLQVTPDAIGGAVVDNAVLRLDTAATTSFAQSVSGSGQLQMQNIGRVTLTGTHTHTGGTWVRGGTLVIGRAAALPTTGALVVDGRLDIGTGPLQPVAARAGSLAGALGGLVQIEGSLAVGGSGASTLYAGSVAGSGQLVKEGAGTLTLAGPVQSARGLAVAGGTVRLQSSQVIDGAPLALLGGVIDLGSNRIATTALSFGDGVLGGPLGRIASAAGAVLQLGGSLQVQGAASRLSDPVALDTAVVLAAPVTVSGSQRTWGSYDLVFRQGLSGSGALTFSGGLVTALAAQATHSGGTRVGAGSTLVLGRADALPGEGALTVDGLLRLDPLIATQGVAAGAFDQTVGALQGGGSIQLGTARLTVGAGGADSRWDGSLVGDGVLVKTGIGTLVLGGSNSHRGGTQVDGGTLRLASAGALLSESPVRVNAGVLDTGGFAQLWSGLQGAGEVRTGAGALRIGALDASTRFTGRLLGSGTLTKVGTGSFTLADNLSQVGDVHLRTGVLQIERGQLAAPGGVVTEAGTTLRLVGAPELLAPVLSHAGTLSGGGRLAGLLQTQSGGTLSLGAGEQLQVAGTGNRNDGLQAVGAGRLVYDGSFENRGQVTLAGGSLVVGTTLQNKASGVIVGQGALRVGADGLRNDGVLDFTGGTTTIDGPVFNALGTVRTAAAATTVFSGAVVSNGEVRTAIGGTTRFLGDVSGAGSYTGGGRVEFLGTYRPGNSPAQVEFDGDVVFGDVLEIDVGGTLAGEQNDQLIFHGQATLGGTLRIVLLNGFVPSAGQTLQLFQGATAGRFSQVELPTLPAGMQWDAAALAEGRPSQVVAVPEPATWALWLTGLVVGAAGTARRRATAQG